MSSSSVAASSVMASGAGSGSAAAAGHDDVLMSSGNTGHGINRVTDNGVAITGLCWFECGQLATQNQGTVKYPKLVCGPCRSANRALVSQITEAGKENPGVKVAYHKMVKLNPQQYKNMIRSSRIATASDMPGVSTLAARDAQLSLYKQRILTQVPQYRASQHQ
jgi:hypothetical protein